MNRTWIAALALAVALGCTDGAGPLNSNVQVSFATRDPAAPTASGQARAPRAPGVVTASDTLTDGTNTLIITRAEIVLEKIKFEPVEVADCDVDPEPAGCEDIELGPVLVDLPLGPGAAQQFEVDLPAAAYNEIQFVIHKVTSDAVDAAFRAAHPDFPVGQSIRVQGTFNGAAFVYQTELNVEQELDLTPPLVVTDTTTGTNVTVRVGLAGWFRASGGSLINPASGNKGQPNESLVNENIKRSIEAFEDRDADGDESDEG
ncbi:MAG: hypothetical protein HY337_11400 [Gemmatimonadetes bacterium]|nr:hypothetical protein [Gemmatimonadota bacterium]